MSQISDDVYKIRIALRNIVSQQIIFKALLHIPHSVHTPATQSKAHYNAMEISALHDLSLVIRGKNRSHGATDEAILRVRRSVLEPAETRTPEVA